MTILDKIIRWKIEEVRITKSRVDEQELREMPLFGSACFDLCASIQSDHKNGIIAEFKRASPSKGVINSKANVRDVAKAYADAGVSAISVLTDTEFFKGSLKDLSMARETVEVPILRKDFIVDPYQIIESKAYGADVILLIASVLGTREIRELSGLAKSLGMFVLVEVHNRQELEKCIYDTVDAIGVNNRDLHDFSVSTARSFELGHLIPNEFIKISESGISDASTIMDLKRAGFQGFLIGENFMKSGDPAQEVKTFCSKLV